MKVLIVYASRYGSTQGIAERIASIMRQQGLEADLRSAGQAPAPAGYDATIIGSAAYFFRWMKPAANYVRRHSQTLERMPLWLFSSGPLGSNPNDAQGRDLCLVSVPREIAEFIPLLHPREHRVFFGAMDHAKLGFFFNLLRKMPVNRNDAIFPQGDFRNWPEIDGWANAIAQALWAL